MRPDVGKAAVTTWGSRDSAIMVNRPLPAVPDAQPCGLLLSAKNRQDKSPIDGQGALSISFAQILGKLHFFDLLEKLRIILLDYAQKRPGIANAAFKPAC